MKAATRGRLEKMRDQRTILWIRNRREIAPKLVDKNVTLLLLAMRGYQFAADLDVIVFRIGFRAKLGHNAAVNRDLAAYHHLFDRAARSNAGVCDYLLEAFDQNNRTDRTNRTYSS